jgi:hypothetical protein
MDCRTNRKSMEGIQKDVDAIQQYMLELQLSTGIETCVVVKTNKEENQYFFCIMVNVNGEFEPAVDDMDFDSTVCYLTGLSIGYELAISSSFRKIHSN